jgi:hypothetical protein
MTEIINLAAALSLIQIWVFEVMPMFRNILKTPLKDGYVYWVSDEDMDFKYYACGFENNLGTGQIYTQKKNQAKEYNSIEDFEREYTKKYRVDIYGKEILYMFEPKKADSILYTTLNRKPFTCSSCLSFWIGLTLSIIFLNPIYLTLYLFTQIYERYV